MLYLHITSKPGFSRTLSFSQTWGKTEILPDGFFFVFWRFLEGFFWRYEQHLRAKSLHLYIFSAIAAIFYCCHAGSFNCCPL